MTRGPHGPPCHTPSKDEPIVEPETRTFIQYYRDRKGRPRGCVVCIADPAQEPDTDRYGWSLCRKDDTFTRDRGRWIAIQRALATHQQPIPPTMIPLDAEVWVRVRDWRRRLAERAGA
jgi:hypothetical protein